MSGKIDFVDPETGEIITTAYTAPKTNQYSVQVPAGRKYYASIYASGYTKSNQDIDFSEAIPGSEITKSFGLTRVDKSLPSTLFLNVVDAKTGKQIKNAVVELQEVESEPILVYSKSNGYDCIIYPGQSIKISVKANDYMGYEEIFDIPFSAAKQKLTRTVRLGKLTAGSKIVIRNIFFDFNKSTFRPNSFEALAGLKQLMGKYPTLKVEISGHTDNVGSVEFNQKLSNSRAQVVYDYLVRNGIDPNRLKFQGKGFSDPIAPNDIDENRQLNRRTEMYIIAR
jgi:outer membrane protein OmpA-like peptidoglycan-associated protein